QREVERQLGDVARGKAHHEVAAAPGDGAECRLAVGPAHRVIDHVRAAAVAERLDPLPQILAGIVDGGVGAVLDADSELLRARGARDYACAQSLADLDGGEAYAARRPKHEQRLPSAQGRAVAQRMV